MRTLARFALTIGTALLAGCGVPSNAPPIVAPAAMPRLAESTPRGTGEVQYISNFYTGTLLEFDYPKGESSVGSIGFSGGGLCTKGARTFWVAGSGEIAEFKAGGATPIRVLKASAGACAIDPATGDLAALTSGGVIIFHKARGKGKVITPPVQADFDGYDNQGNLFADGFKSGTAFELVELKKGSSTFETITTSNTVGFPGAVQWDGNYLTIGDQANRAIYQYTVSGTMATLKGTVSLSGSSDCVQTWIAQPYVYCADVGNDDGEVFKYPAGGSPIATLKGSFDFPVGVVSLRVR